MKSKGERLKLELRSSKTGELVLHPVLYVNILGYGEMATHETLTLAFTGSSPVSSVCVEKILKTVIIGGKYGGKFQMVR